MRSGSKSHISDEQLVAYLDGEADSAARTEIERQLPADPDLRERFDELAAGGRPFAEVGEWLLSEAPTARLSDRLQDVVHRTTPVATGRRRFARLAIAASLLATLGVGTLAGVGIAPRLTPQPAAAMPSWRLAIATYMNLYSAETLRSHELTPEQRAADLAYVSAALGRTLTGDYVSLPELDLREAQILRFRDRPLAKLVFLDRNDTPVALCIIQTTTADQDPTHETLLGLASTSWIRDGFAYLVIGSAPAEAIAAIAAGFDGRLG